MYCGGIRGQFGPMDLLRVLFEQTNGSGIRGQFGPMDLLGMFFQHPYRCRIRVGT